MEGGVDLRALAGWAQSSTDTWLFYLLAFTAIPFAYGILLDPRIIRVGFLLIGVFGAISGLFFLLQAQFLALAQLMIYAVGITLVVVIALMLTNPRLEHDSSATLPAHRVPGVLTGVFVFVTLYFAVRSEIWNTVSKPVNADNVLQLGMLLLTHYSLPFEFASVLLLIAMIGAVMLAKSEREEPTLSEDWIEAEENFERTNDVVKV